MSTSIKHRRVTIVVLAPGEQASLCCGPGDIAICSQPDGWWTRFIAEDGSIDSYDQPYPTYLQALWAAKAAAEFGF
ncbi:MAG: hypothetical protein V4723_16195 [Pseudomonadota bacterium]